VRELLLLAEHKNTHHKHERREQEEGEANMSRFAGCGPIFFKPVIGGSNVVALAPNLVSSFLT